MVTQTRRASGDPYRERIAAARRIDPAAVMAALGGERDRYDKHKWRINGEHISINGDLFYNHDRQDGGRGAIDLVMHVRGMDVQEAVAWLTGRPWETDRAIALPAARQRGDGQERSGGSAAKHFMPPEPAAERWPAVRAYLTEERGLPGRIVDALHERGLVYADHRQNAVFVRCAPDGTVTGASLRGTRDGTGFKGMAPGTDRSAGWFHYRTGETEPYTRPTVMLTESPIDAISVHALRALADERGRVLLISTDGAGALPAALIAGALSRGWTVQAGFDNDRAGEQCWVRLAAQYPEETAAGRIWRVRPPAGKDWNDALRAVLAERSQGERDDHGR